MKIPNQRDLHVALIPRIFLNPFEQIPDTYVYIRMFSDIGLPGFLPEFTHPVSFHQAGRAPQEVLLRGS